MWKQGDRQLHHDNAPAHSSHLDRNFLANHEKKPTSAAAPLFNRHGPCDFFLFPKVKMLKRKMFQDTKEMKRNVTTELLAIPRSHFHKCFGQWKDRWNKCVVFEGDYFEGDYDCSTIGYFVFPGPWSDTF
jgi:hypothetical protein